MRKVLKTTNIPINSTDSIGRCISNKLKQWFGSSVVLVTWGGELRWPQQVSLNWIKPAINPPFQTFRFPDYLEHSDKSIPDDCSCTSLNYLDDVGETVLTAMIVHRPRLLNGRQSIGDHFTVLFLQLLRTDVDVNVCNKSGLSPLVLAMRTGQYDLIEDVMNSDDKTPVIRLQRYTYAKLLIEARVPLLASYVRYAGALKYTALILKSLEKQYQQSPEQWDQVVDFLRQASEQPSPSQT